MNVELNFIEGEHKDLLLTLKKASIQGGRAGDEFAKVFEIFRGHMEKEANSVLPLISYLSDRLLSKSLIDKAKLIAARDSFEYEYDDFLNEHSQMVALLKEIVSISGNEHRKDNSGLALRMMGHLQLEESVIYPAAFASGDLLEWERELLGQKIRY